MLHDLVAVSRPHGAARALELQRVLEMFEGAMQTLARHLKTVWCVYAAVSDCKIIMKRLTVQWNNIKGTGEDLAGKFEQMVLALGPSLLKATRSHWPRFATTLCVSLCKKERHMISCFWRLPMRGRS